MFATATTSAPYSRQRHGGLDVVRLLLACIVVLAHASFFLTISPEAHYTVNNGVARLIVPFFFVMSGYFFEQQTRAGLWSWVRKVASYYLIWTAIYLPIILIYEDFSLLRLGFYAVFGYAHLWFLPALLGGGVMFHLLRNIGNRQLVILAVSLVAVGVALQYFEDITQDMEHLRYRHAHEAEVRNFLFMGFPFVALGVVIRRTRFAEGELRARDWVLLGLGSIVLFAEIGFNYRYLPTKGIFELVFSAVVMAPLLFRFANALPLRVGGRKLRDLSSAIYFSHLLPLIPLRAGFDLSFGELALLALVLSFALAPLLLRLNRWLPLF
ncbi:Fucose 4-O-acetylase [Thalassovita gelatinovora]|uniref:Fucose 4-O-acetylase n=1 Tax=Thalassovita gelatinovora TaxID=53501 RepID=A0A0P1F4G3_THAGE|nr:acyltransferase family protein [Thalassovita gelatinovora]QIZ79366.1 acyltransferase [Thalassovita gelatinovora]CUH62660.1 Fucose 4-O-acetylase [Thalassovita gelatinovora]SEQ08110.1 Surface polysaccharide O-acyltransferase, integral membrane enzyme [Thalassovita gelatinovora]